MSSQLVKTQGAEDRFRQAFNRLKDGVPTSLERGTPVTQNNVAREAGCDPSALKKARFPVLIREIQAYIELHSEDRHSNEKKIDARAANRTLKERMEDAIKQRDQAQSILAGANLRIIELSEQVQSLQRQLDENPPSSIPHKL